MGKNKWQKILNSYRISIQARWIYIVAMISIGILTKIFGTANINFPMSYMLLLVFAAVTYNLLPKVLLEKFHEFRNTPAVNFLSFAQFVFDLAVITVVIHFAGGIESISFIFYFFVIVSSSFIYKRTGIYAIALLAAIFYNLLIYSEYYGVIEHAYRYLGSDSAPHQALDVVTINTFTISVAILISGFFVGYLSYLRTSFEENAEREKELRLKDEMKTRELRYKFVTVLTHQFRTPLTHIKLALAELISVKEKFSSYEYGLIENSWISLKRALIILERLTKTRDLEEEGRPIHKEMVNVGDYIRKSLNDYSYLARQKNMKIVSNHEAMPDARILGSQFLINLLFDTLIENALDYGDEGAEVAVNLSREQNDIVLTVKDRGIYISPSDAGKIFEKFYRTDEAMQKITDKSGLSLYLAKLIAERHGGTIGFISEPSGETEFRLRLPLAA